MSGATRLALASLRHGLLMLGLLFVLLPFVWMLLTAAKAPSEIFTASLSIWPSQFHFWENLTAAFTRTALDRFLLNGVIVTTAILLAQLCVVVPCAYALACMEFRGRRLLVNLVIACILVPPFAVVLPVFVLFSQTGLLNSYLSLILPFVASSFGIFLFYQAFRTIPKELFEAARIDGLSEPSIAIGLALPNAIPALTAFAVFSVISHWNDYFWPLVMLNDEAYFTPALGVARFRNDEAGTDFGPLMAAAFVVVTPLILAFLVAQRRFIDGIAFSGIR